MLSQSDQLPPAELQALRTEQRSVTAAIARNWTPEPRAGPLDPNYGPYIRNKYADLGRAFFLSYLSNEMVVDLSEQYPVLTGSSVLNGFDVTTRILEYAPEAYATYCESGDITPDPRHLEGIMQRSFDTVRFFTDCDNDTNHVLELWFGLKYGRQMDDNPFVITEDNDTSRFQPSSAMMEYRDAIPELDRALNAREYAQHNQPYRSCSGKAIVAKLWESAVKLCCDDPMYFQADINNILGLREPSPVQ